MSEVVLAPRQPVDMRKRGWEKLLPEPGVERLNVNYLHAGQAASLASMGFARLRDLNARHPRVEDLRFVEYFPLLERLEVWQSNSVTSISGVEGLSNLRYLSLSTLGPIASLEPISKLTSLNELFLTSGVWKYQHIGELDPLAELKGLRRLALTARGPTDLSALLSFDQLEHLHLATAQYPIEEVARVAARYPFWAAGTPWFHRFNDDDIGCSRCGGVRSGLFLHRRKRLWCEVCDSERLRRTLEEFESLIRNHKEPQ